MAPAKTAPADAGAPPAAAAAAKADPTIHLENTGKRDHLKKLEREYQAKWKEARYFEVDSPYQTEQGLEDLSPEEVRKKFEKHLVTIPYAYANGALHLGHAFSISKVEFVTGFERMRGKRALFPWAFHCTGMPIKSAADKLAREVELFGPDFAGYKAEEEAAAAAVPPAAAADGAANPANVAKATKGKVSAKSTGLKYQFQILENSGVPRDEIHKFADPYFWLKYFPPITMDDCNALGARIDWRRAFLTTDVNPYYDSFVRWQMNKLRAMDKIKFGERYTIFSPKDDQPCMDHDRSEGEALGPQEYTALKMEVVQWSGKAAPEVDAKLQGKKVFFVAATLRPETMYGQTNCYVGPAIEYGLFDMGNDEVFLCTERAVRNMAYQGTTPARGKYEELARIEGSKLVGTKIKAPFGHYPEVYILPMDSVLPTKGTGVVTSVPSDSPDDYINLMELRKKAEYYGIDPQWAALDPFPVVSTPTYGNLAAEAIVKQLKIQSPKDKTQLAEAKDMCYKEGFYNGTMLAGTFKGEPVEQAKPKVRAEMIKAGLAFAYAEPEGKIISRSSDECVVALCDQWYIDYGEPSWKAKAEKLVDQMECYQDETRNGFKGVLGWLHQWACARSYGLGSKLPWDQQFLVESLSDSTIYMSYYTVAHLLQGGVADGSKVGPLGIKAEELTDEVWDFVLGSSEAPKQTAIDFEKLKTLRREFRYFYPFDIRSSGKDLIPNHLTFCIYIHAALFPEEHWPRSMRANGHLMLNGKKMSKSTGNALTLRQAVEKFGADATRICLADAGDGIEDANFEEKAANAIILRIHTLLEWCEEQVKRDDLRTGAADSFWDRAFENDMNTLIETTYECYDKLMFKDAMKYAFYELHTARDLYREATADIGMHADLVKRWMAVQALIMTPVAPHFSEHLWQGVLGNKTSVQKELWPKVSAPVDRTLADAADFVRTQTKLVRDSEIALTKKKGKGVAKVADEGYDVTKPKSLTLYVASGFPAWQDTCVKAIQDNYDAKTKEVDDAKVRESLTAAGLLKDKRAMPFVMSFKRRLADFGPEVAFDRGLPFDEIKTLEAASSYLKKTLKMAEVHIEKAEEAAKAGRVSEKVVEAAQPGKPAWWFKNI